MTPELAAIRESLTEAQRAELRRRADAMPRCRCGQHVGHSWDEPKARILAAIRGEWLHDVFRDAARAVLAVKAPQEPVVMTSEAP